MNAGWTENCIKGTGVIPMAEENAEAQTVVLGEKKLEQLSKQPIIESFVNKSQDGKWIVHKTTITDIKPMSYFDKVLNS